MRRFLILISILALLPAGCFAPVSPAVTPIFPADGGTVTSLTPALSWRGTTAGAVYRLIIAADNNFQNAVVNAGNLADFNYTVPPGKLRSNTLYYWRVQARKGDQVSGWTAPRSFLTPGSSPASTGNIIVSATLDGAPWSGSLKYQVSGSYSDFEYSVPWSLNNIPAGNYTVTYNYGGPDGATLAGITTAPTQQLTAGGTISFTLNFRTPSSSNLSVSATLDGQPWSGSVNYSIYGPFKDMDTTVPHTFVSVPAGTYTVSYNSGGPGNAFLNGISPSASQVLPNGSEIEYKLNFISARSSSLSVTASYNGSSWSGPVNFSISGPISGSYSSVPLQLSNVPAGTYSIRYRSGGPNGATMGNILPDTMVVIGSGRSGVFTLNYYAQSQTGNMIVNATLNGSPWSGAVNFAISGPFLSPEYQVPRTYNTVPTGMYTITYLDGGPSNAIFSSITPAPTQLLSAGGSVVFNLNFVGQPDTGTIMVNATVDGQLWQTASGSGPISYSLDGPNLVDNENSIPVRLPELPAGSYTLTYNSGGPIGATLVNISPSPTQYLAAGGSIVFNLNFTSQARGYVMVNAALDGQPWSGSVSYVLQGPYIHSETYVPMTFSDAPQGTYSVQYQEGGPPLANFAGVFPSSQELSPGGSITFTIIFTSFSPVPNPNPEPEPGPMPGPVPNPNPEPGPMPGPVPNPNPEPGPMPGPVPNPNSDDSLSG